MRQASTCVHSQKPLPAWGAQGLQGHNRTFSCPGWEPGSGQTLVEEEGKKSTGCPGTGEDIANDV